MGSKSRAKRPLTEKEFLLEMELMKRQPDWAHNIKYPCMSIWQFSFIGRIDDTCHHEVGDPRGHKQFPFALMSKVRWSKNVIDERRCPDQIILGAADPRWCLLIHLAIYYETMLAMHPQAKYMFTEQRATHAASKSGDGQLSRAGGSN